MGLLDRFKGRLAQRKEFVQKERAIEREAYHKERLKLAEKKGIARARSGGFTDRAAKAIKTYQKQVAKRNKLKGKEGFSFAGPNVATPRDNNLYEVKDFRK